MLEPATNQMVGRFVQGGGVPAFLGNDTRDHVDQPGVALVHDDQDGGAFDGEGPA